MLKKQKYIILGDTRDFHIGSLINCENLTKTLNKKYKFNGYYAKSDFSYESYDEFLRDLPNLEALTKSIEDSDLIYCNGEGMIEPESKWGHSFFYIAKYIKEKFSSKKVFLVNFSCDISDFDDWNIFDYIIPRDVKTFDLLKNQNSNILLGFDCTIIQEDVSNFSSDNKQITFFRGRRDIYEDEIKDISNRFKKDTYLDSIFWNFDNKNAEESKDLIELQNNIKNSFLVVSSSFHGIIFSTRFGIPFIPLETDNTSKNESIGSDILEELYENRSLTEWLDFYSNKDNYLKVKDKLQKRLPELQSRTDNFIL